MSKKKLVVLSGAGISAESGIKTFRDSDGLWENYNIEDVATPDAWAKNLALVLEFYNHRRRQIKAAQPNAAHLALAALEQYFDVQIITQNIDDLHERAGNTNVLHLHGEIFKMCSEKNKSLITPIQGDIKIGDLAADGNQQRPYIVWFGEMVPMIEYAIPIIEIADLFLVIGTSMVVYPAASLINFVPEAAPKFIIDPNVPSTARHNNLTIIEATATEGMEILKNKHLIKYL